MTTYLDSDETVYLQDIGNENGIKLFEDSAEARNFASDLQTGLNNHGIFAICIAQPYHPN